MALYTIEAEYIVATKACKELLRLKKFLHNLGLVQERYNPHCDSQSVTNERSNFLGKKKSKNIDMRHSWI